MIYHLLVNLPDTLTGIERASIQRHQLIKEKYNSKLLTVSYNRNLYHTVKKYHMDSNDYLNLHDYFQQVAGKSEIKQTKKEELFPTNDYDITVVPKTNNQDYRVFKAKKLVAYIHTASDDGRIVYINYFDKNIDKRERHLYDCRGFLSVIQYLDDQQREMFERFLTPSGETVIEKTYSMKSKSRELSQIKLYTSEGMLFFYSEEDFMTYFFDQLLTENDLTISDRNRFINPIILKSKISFKKIGILHSTHYIGDDPTNNLKSHYQVLFKERKRFDAIVSSTQKQRLDVIERFENEDQMYCIPVAARKSVPQNQLTISKDKPLKIAMIARYSPEKRLDHGIKAFSKISQKYPNAELHLYGFGSNKNRTILSDVIEELGLTNRVFLRGYLPDLDEELKTVHLKLLTSHEEGFCIAVLEALSHGIPVISYDINYGPSDMIVSNENGFLVEDENIDQISERIDRIFSNPAGYQRLSDNAYQSADAFSAELLREKWWNLFETLSVPIKEKSKAPLKKRLSLFRR